MGDSPEKLLASILNVSVENAPKNEEEIRARLQAGGARAEALREDEPVEDVKREKAAPPEARLPSLDELVGVEPDDPLVSEEELRRIEELRDRLVRIDQELAETVLESSWVDGNVRVATDGFGRLLSLDIGKEAVGRPRGLGFALVEAVNSARHDAREAALARRARAQEEVTGGA